MWCGYSYGHTLVKGTIRVTGYEDHDAAKQVDKRNEDVIFENFAQFRKWISDEKCRNKKAKDIDNVMPVYDLIQYSNNYSETFESLWQYHRDEPNKDITNSE